MILISLISLIFLNETLGGYCGGVPPLPIPNREVKPVCADGTAMQCGRVGGCLLYNEVFRASRLWRPFFVFGHEHFFLDMST